MTAISEPAPNRSVTNAILPSTGEKAAPESFAGSLVRRTKLEPSPLIAQMSAPPSPRQSKAIRLPSGDQTNDPVKPTLFVRRVTFDPSTSVT